MKQTRTIKDLKRLNLGDQLFEKIVMWSMRNSNCTKNEIIYLQGNHREKNWEEIEWNKNIFQKYKNWLLKK